MRVGQTGYVAPSPFGEINYLRFSARGVGRDGIKIHGLALSPIYVVAGLGANLPFLAMLIAAHAEVEDDLPRRPSAERWEVLLKMVEDEQERFAKERLRLLTEMEQRRN